MAYTFKTADVPDGAYGETMPSLTITVTGTHDISRIVGLLDRGNCEQGDLCSRITRSLRQRTGGRAALDLLKRHGGPDHTAEPRRSVYWDHLGPWTDWGPRITALGLPTCANALIAHLYGQHDDALHGYCPMCDEIDGCVEGDRQAEAAYESELLR